LGISAKLIDCQVTHKRFTPKVHEFKNSFFWFELDLDQIDDDFSKLPLISHNRFNIFEFRDRDHIDFGKGSLRDNVEHFLLQNGDSNKPSRIRLWTHLRVFGYVFNPVSFYLIDMPDGTKRMILEVGNTFNELKPFYVPFSAFDGNKVRVSVPKHFYVSPFIALDTIFTFSLNLSDDQFTLGVMSDYESGERVLSAGMKGKFRALTTGNLIKSLVRHPFVTIKVITLIHWHALLLWLKGIPYFKKTDNQELQRGNMIWKK
jgi:DUF1365 family protein